MGHLMCAGCFTHLLADGRLRDQVATCPNCRVEISKNNASRNLAVEKAVSELPSACQVNVNATFEFAERIFIKIIWVNFELGGGAENYSQNQSIVKFIFARVINVLPPIVLQSRVSTLFSGSPRAQWMRGASNRVQIFHHWMPVEGTDTRGQGARNILRPSKE